MTPRHRSIVEPDPSLEPEVRPLRDSPQFVLVGIALFLAALVGLLQIAGRSTELAPDYLTEVVLYALSAACLTMLVVLGFVLARNIVKLWVERRRSAPFARFRAKLVAALLGMTLIPAVLVLLVGSELIRNSAERWFSAPVDQVLTSANEIARDYYREHEQVVAAQARDIAERLGGIDLEPGSVTAIRAVVEREVTAGAARVVDIYRVETDAAGERIGVEPLVEVASSTMPQGYARAAAERLAAQVAAGRGDVRRVEPMRDGDEMVRAAALIEDGGGETVGVVVASGPLGGEVAFHARRINGAYESYRQLRALRRPLAGAYLSFFVMITLMILLSATWLGVYVARRITRPVRLLAAGAREIGAGRLDHRIQPESQDEFGSLVDAFNAMAGELSMSRRKLERSRRDVERKNRESDRRRRYIETILERIATGVVSVDADGRVGTVNAAASRLLALAPDTVGRPADEVFERADLAPLATILQGAGRGGRSPRGAEEVAMTRAGRELHLAVAATVLPGDVGAGGGTVMVFDDVTPLIRAERVSTWRDVARRLAHEIKNPLTPIQLCAERIGRHFSGSPSQTRALVDECTATIVGEVEALKGLVDEFSQFARMPAPRTNVADLNAIVADALSLYDDLLPDITVSRSFGDTPRLQLDAEQIRRLVVNLVDNAADAIRGGGSRRDTSGNRGIIEVTTVHDPAAGVVRLAVRDNGPGIPRENREKLFMPYFSTKRRGSGLGLAIVRRIVVEHGGSIAVGDNEPAGTRVTVELPCPSGLEPTPATRRSAIPEQVR